MFFETSCICINMIGCIEVNDHNPNIYMNETEIKPQFIYCRNFDTYIF